MDLLISGIEIPTEDTECIKILLKGRVVLHYSIGDTPKALGEVIPVSKHGRLIDADALEKDFEKLAVQDNWYYNALYHAPTIIKASEKVSK